MSEEFERKSMRNEAGVACSVLGPDKDFSLADDSFVCIRRLFRIRRIRDYTDFALIGFKNGLKGGLVSEGRLACFIEFVKGFGPFCSDNHFLKQISSL